LGAYHHHAGGSRVEHVRSRPAAGGPWPTKKPRGGPVNPPPIVAAPAANVKPPSTRPRRRRAPPGDGASPGHRAPHPHRRLEPEAVRDVARGVDPPQGPPV